MKNTTTPPLNFPSNKTFSPLLQAACSLVLGLVGIVVTKILGEETFYQFVFAFTGIVVYCLVNAIISVFRDSFVRYTLVSWWVYIGLVIILLLFARFISGESIQSHKEFIQMLISLSIFYVVVSVVVRIIRAVWQFAENDKW